MCVLSLFGWDKSTTVLHSKHTDFDMNDVEKRTKMLGGACVANRTETYTHNHSTQPQRSLDPDRGRCFDPNYKLLQLAAWVSSGRLL